VEEMLFVSPVSGGNGGGSKRCPKKILTLKILADKSQEFVSHASLSLECPARGY